MGVVSWVSSIDGDIFHIYEIKEKHTEDDGNILEVYKKVVI